jgi:hypothetical protein
VDPIFSSPYKPAAGSPSLQAPPAPSSNAPKRQLAALLGGLPKAK